MTQSSDKFRAWSNSSEEEFLICSTLETGTYKKKGKNTEGVADGVKFCQQKRSAPDLGNMNSWLKFRPDYRGETHSPASLHQDGPSHV